jgi:hypothetical protein
VTTKNASRIDTLERLIHGLEQDAIRILQRIERLEGILFRLVGALAHADRDIRDLMISRPDLVTDQLELWRDWTAKLGSRGQWAVEHIVAGWRPSQIPPKTDSPNPA